MDTTTDPPGKYRRSFGMTGGAEGAADRMMLIKDFVAWSTLDCIYYNSWQESEEFHGVLFNDSPHQALTNFTSAYVPRVNNKTALLHKLKIMKQAARERRKSYWVQPENSSHDRGQGGYPGYGSD